MGKADGETRGRSTVPPQNKRMKPQTRKLLGAAGLLAFISIYAVLAATLGGLLAQAPLLVQLAYFAVAGFVWILPLKPLFRWMNQP